MADGPRPSDRLPSDAELVRTTVEFDELDLPSGLLRAHHLAADTWGVMRVRSGSVRFVYEEVDDAGRVVAAGSSQIIPPEVLHHLELVGPVRFVIEFHRCPAH